MTTTNRAGSPARYTPEHDERTSPTVHVRGELRRADEFDPPHPGVPVFDFTHRHEPIPLPERAERVTPGDVEVVVGNRDQLKHKIIDAWERGATTVHIDLSKCGYIDSSGLGALLSALKRGRTHHDVSCAIVLEHANEDLRNLFEMTKMAALFRFLP